MGCFSVIAEFFRRERRRAIEEERRRRRVYGDNNRARRRQQQQRPRQRAMYPEALPCDNFLEVFPGEDGRGTVTGDVLVSDPALVESLREFIRPLCTCEVAGTEASGEAGTVESLIGTGYGIIVLMDGMTREILTGSEEENFSSHHISNANTLNDACENSHRSDASTKSVCNCSNVTRDGVQYFKRIPDECVYSTSEYIRA